MFWNWLERVSWVAGIVSVLIALITSLMAARSAKLAARELTMLVAAALEKPELLEKLELETRARSEAVRRRVRAVVVSVSTAVLSVAALALAAVMLANVPDHVSTEVVGGDAPKTVPECVKAGEASFCAPMHVYELAAGAKVETRFGGVDRSPARKGSGGLSVELPGCGSEVRWHVVLDGRTVAEAVSRDVRVNVRFPMTSDGEYTFVAEQVGGGCAVTEVVVRTGFTFEG